MLSESPLCLLLSDCNLASDSYQPRSSPQPYRSRFTVNTSLPVPTFHVATSPPAVQMPAPPRDRPVPPRPIPGLCGLTRRPLPRGHFALPPAWNNRFRAPRARSYSSQVWDRVARVKC
jgi:hypothetical protein